MTKFMEEIQEIMQPTVESRKPKDVFKAMMEVVDRTFKKHDDCEGWQPIETAPKDGTDILIYCYGERESCSCAYFDKGYWIDKDYPVKGIPTHWMPLPEPPK